MLVLTVLALVGVRTAAHRTTDQDKQEQQQAQQAQQAGSTTLPGR